MNASEARKVELDVRPQLKNKLEPFQLIMDTVKTLGPDDVFVLHAPFRPTPLLGVMKMKGFAGRAVPVEKDHWIVHFVRKKNRHWLDELAPAEGADGRADAFAVADLPAGMPLPFRPDARETRGDADESGPAGRNPDADGEPRVITLDNRGLEPPQPMIRTLSFLERCRPGDTVRIHNDRVPVFLLEELKNLGCPYEVEEQPDGSAKFLVECFFHRFLIGDRLPVGFARYDEHVGLGRMNISGSPGVIAVGSGAFDQHHEQAAGTVSRIAEGKQLFPAAAERVSRHGLRLPPVHGENARPFPHQGHQFRARMAVGGQRLSRQEVQRQRSEAVSLKQHAFPKTVFGKFPDLVQ